MTKANNKKTFWLSFFSLGLFFLFIPTLFGSAAFSETINYQGKLMDDAGDLVADGSYNMRFRLCADDACASVLYDESWINSDKVAVTNGLFSVLIGSVSSTLGSVDFNQDVYLEVSVGGTDAPVWEALSPRKRLGAVPNAFNTQKFDGLATTSFLRADIANATGTINNLNSQTLLVSSSLGIGTTTPQTALHVVGTSTLGVTSMDYNSWIGSALGFNSIQFGQKTISNGSFLDGLTFNTIDSVTIDSVSSSGLSDSIILKDSLALNYNGVTDSHLAFIADGYDKVGVIGFNTSDNAFTFVVSDDNMEPATATYEFFGNILFNPNRQSTNMIGFNSSLITNTIINASGTLGVMHNALTASSDYNGVSNVIQDNKVFGNQIVRSGAISNYGYNTIEVNRSQRNWTDNLAVYSGTQDLYVYNYTQSLILRDDSEFNSPGHTLTSNNYNLHIDSVLTNTETAGTIDVKNYGVYLEHVDSSGVSLSNGSVDTIGIYLKNIEGHPSGRTYGIYDSSGENWYMSGNFGIGTTTPQTALHVVGTSTLGVTSMSYDSWIGSELGTNSIQFTDYTISAGYGSGSNINLVTASNDVSFLGVANGLGVYGRGGSDATIVLGNDSYAYTTFISQNSADNELTVAQIDSGLNPYPFSQMKLTADKILLDGNTNSDIVLDFDGRGSITVATTTGYMNFTSATGYNFTGPVTTTQLFSNQLSIATLSGVLQATNGLVSVTTSPTFNSLKTASLYFSTSTLSSPLIYSTNSSDLLFSGATDYSWLNNSGSEFFNINSSSSQLKVKGNPSVIASNLSLPISIRSLQISGNYLYAAFYGDNSIDAFRIIDISDPENPSVVGGSSLVLPNAAAKRLSVVGDYAYVTFHTATGTDAFRIIDIKDKSNPVVVGGAGVNIEQELSSGEPLYVSGNYLYLLANNKNSADISDLITIDISNPHNPKIVSQLENLPREGWDIKVKGDYAYGCFHDEDTPLAIINIKDKRNPQIVATSSVGGVNEFCWSVELSESRLYLGMGNFVGGADNEDVFRIVDIKDPASPNVLSGENIDLKVGEGQLGGINHMKALGQYLYATTWGGYFYKINVSSSTNPIVENYSYLSEGPGDNDAQSPLTFDFSGNNLFVGFAPIPSTGESTRYFRVYSLPGVNSSGGYFSSLFAGLLKVNNDAIFDRRLSVADSLLVGSGGIFSEGGLSVISTTSVSYFGGQLTIGTTTATSTTSSLVVGGAILSTDLLGGPTTLSTDANGNIIRTPSDMRLKENVELINGALSGVLALNPVYYNWKDKSRFGEQREIGLLAQEVQGIFPEVISAGSEYLSVNYQALVPVLVSAIKDQQEQINAIAEGKELLAVSDTPYATDNLSINKLTVRKAASFYGTIIVVGEAGFATKVTFSDHVYFNEDSAGTAKIVANATSTEIKFAKPYETAPIITITPKKKMSGTSWWVENESVDGFTIAIDPVSEQEWEFNWQAVAISGVGISAVPEDVSPVEPEVVPEELVPDTDSGLENSTGTALQLIIDNSAGLPESTPEEPNLSLEDTSGMVPEGPVLPAEEPQEQSSQNEPSESE